MQGPSRESMLDFLESMDLTVSTQDGKTVIRRFNGVSPDTAVLLSPESGLKERYVQFRDLGRATVTAFLNAKLEPFRQVSIVDGNKKPQGAGIFRVDRVEHIGDTMGGQWDSICEVRPSKITP